MHIEFDTYRTFVCSPICMFPALHLRSSVSTGFMFVNHKIKRSSLSFNVCCLSFLTKHVLRTCQSSNGKTKQCNGVQGCKTANTDGSLRRGVTLIINELGTRGLLNRGYSTLLKFSHVDNSLGLLIFIILSALMDGERHFLGMYWVLVCNFAELEDYTNQFRRL